MAAPATKNPPAPAESKSARKKRSKAERTESPAPAGSTPEKTPSIAEGASDESESPYVRELSKNIRNVNKRLANVSKIDSIISEHKGKSLDELVTLRIINADQRTAYQAKPTLKAQLAQLEEQLNQYKKIDSEYRGRIATERASLEKSLTDKYEKEKATAVSEIKEKAEAESKKVLYDGLLVVSQFLRLAAARRAAEDTNPEEDESLALEGVLLQVYSGDENAVSTMIKLVQGSSDKTRSVSQETLQTTYAQVKSLSIAHAAPLQPTEAPAENTEAEGNKPLIQTDPTIAHAGLTELEDPTTTNLANGHPAEPSGTAHPTNADVADGAANAAGESQWDTGNSMSMSQEWVEVPRDAAETETGLNATPAAPANTQSWADDTPDNPPETTTAADPNDGFHQVQRHRGGRGNHEGGGYRGRGGPRGRGGYRGDGRGRGRGSGRGGGGFRGGRREES